MRANRGGGNPAGQSLVEPVDLKDTHPRPQSGCQIHLNPLQGPTSCTKFKEKSKITGSHLGECFSMLLRLNKNPRMTVLPP